MSQNPTTAPAAPTWADVLALVTKLDASGLEDAEIVLDGVSVRVSKSVLPTPGAVAPEPGPAPAVEAAAPPTPAALPAPSPPVAPDGPTVTAPLLGVLYLRPSPDAEPFVKIGDTVSPDTTVAIIEVMKLMNNVTAGTDGTVVEICRQEGQMVEHGDVLIRLEASS